MRLRGRFAVSDRLQRKQAPWPGCRAFGAQYECLDIAVKELLLLVSERLEFLEYAVEFQLVERKAQLLHAFAEGVPAAVLAEYRWLRVRPTSSGRMIS